MVKDFISEIRGGICSVMGNRYIKTQSKGNVRVKVIVEIKIEVKFKLKLIVIGLYGT